MNKEIVELLKSINDGKVLGSQRKLAKMLGVSDVSVSSWFSKNKKPSEDNIAKMAKIFNKSEEKIQEIFGKNTNEEKGYCEKEDNKNFSDHEMRILRLEKEVLELKMAMKGNV